MQIVGRPGIEELLERSHELSGLADHLADVVEQTHGRVVVVRGEAGIGKTALLRRFCADHGTSARVLWASCDPLFTPRPLGPLLDLARLTEGELQARIEAGAKPHDVSAALLRELASGGPSVLVLEDLHWADEATLDVLRLLTRRVDSVPVLLVATYRDEQLHRTHPLRIVLGELPSREQVTRMELTGLSLQSVAALADTSAVDAEELYARTGGNPFFVTEALAAETELVPETVRDAVLARAARLSESARALLDAVAVVPQRVEVWLLEALAEAALDALDECLGSGILRSEADGVAFRHELARLAIEDSLAPDQAVVLHRRALVALADPAITAPDFARLAHHAEAAGNAQAVLRFAPAAAEQAAALGAPREAQNQYARALRFDDGLADEPRVELLKRYADMGYLTDMREDALEALDEALRIHRAAGDLVEQGDTLRLRSRLLTCMGRTAEAPASGHQAVLVLEQAPPGRELARTYAALSHVSMLVDEFQETIEWGTRAIRLAEQVADTEALVSALDNVGSMELMRGVEAGREKLDRSLRLAEQAGLDPDVGRAYINLVAAYGRRGDWSSADPFIAAGIEYCRERGLEAWLRCLLSARAESELARGRWDDAAATATSILQAPRDSVVGPVSDALTVLGRVRARRGDPEYWPLLDEAKAIADEVGDLQFIAAIAAARAEAAWLEGDHEAVASETEHAYRLAVELAQPSFAGELGSWRRRAGLRIEPDVEMNEVYQLQVTGNWDRAARLWHERGCPYESALALADSDDARVLHRSLEQLHELGARPAAAIVARRLRRLGQRGLPTGPRPRTRENPAGLTQRQLEVLELIAQGLRNADIARRLVVSEKTVGHHVSAILSKLGARTRGEAAAEAARLGITSPAPVSRRAGAGRAAS